MSKTLDQASAQFAASALVTTDQLLAFKSKEELVLASGVNGVLAGTGACPRFTLPLQQLLCCCCVYKSCPVPSRCFQRLAPSQHHHSPSPAQPVGTHYPIGGPNLPPALLQLHNSFACQRRPLIPRLHSQRPRSGSAGHSGLQRCQRHPRHHSGPHRKQHLSERAVGRHPGRAPHPPDPQQRASLCLKAVHHHQPADAQSLRSIVHGPEFKVRLGYTRTALTLQAPFIFMLRYANLHGFKSGRASRFVKRVNLTEALMFVLINFLLMQNTKLKLHGLKGSTQVWVVRRYFGHGVISDASIF